MGRTIAGVAILLAFGAFVIYTAMQQLGTRCEVCVDYEGRRVCEVAYADTEKDAIMQAQSSACTQLTSGVTGIVRCTGMSPHSVQCGPE